MFFVLILFAVKRFYVFRLQKNRRDNLSQRGNLPETGDIGVFCNNNERTGMCFARFSARRQVTKTRSSRVPLHFGVLIHDTVTITTSGFPELGSEARGKGAKGSRQISLACRKAA
jgi:hypothetical protein